MINLFVTRRRAFKMAQKRKKKKETVKNVGNEPT